MECGKNTIGGMSKKLNELRERGQQNAGFREGYEARDALILNREPAAEGRVPQLINQHRREIDSLCRRYGVRALALFGSVLRKDFDPSVSDVDIAVAFGPSPAESAARQYVDFKVALERLLARPVDLLEVGAMEDTPLKRIIERTKVPIYVEAT
jgi:uncharacterized protein